VKEVEVALEKKANVVVVASGKRVKVAPAEKAKIPAKKIKVAAAGKREQYLRWKQDFVVHGDRPQACRQRADPALKRGIFSIREQLSDPRVFRVPRHWW
jgi:hypothetical protein